MKHFEPNRRSPKRLGWSVSLLALVLFSLVAVPRPGTAATGLSGKAGNLDGVATISIRKLGSDRSSQPVELKIANGFLLAEGANGLRLSGAYQSKQRGRRLVVSHDERSMVALVTFLSGRAQAIYLRKTGGTATATITVSKRATTVSADRNARRATLTATVGFTATFGGRAYRGTYKATQRGTLADFQPGDGWPPPGDVGQTPGNGAQAPGNDGQAPGNGGQNPGNGIQPPANPTSFFLPGDAPTRNFEVAYDAAGTMHIAFVRHTADANVQEVLYGTCGLGAGCDNPARWNLGVVHRGAIGTVAFAVTADGRPRLAIKDEYTVVSIRLLYAACEAGCTSEANWGRIILRTGLEHSELFLQHTDPRWFALDGRGLPHLVMVTNRDTFYLSCTSDCLADNGAGWTSARLDTTGNGFQPGKLDAPVLKVSPNGQPHLLGTNVLSQLVYFTCAGACTEPANWQRLALADPSGGQQDELPVTLTVSDHDLEIDPAGRIVAAFGGVLPVPNGANRTYLWRCAADCGSAANWAGRPFPNTPSGGLSLSLDPQGRPYLVILGRSGPSEERTALLATCDGPDCYDFNAAWSAEVVSSSKEMETEWPIRLPGPTPALCSIPTTSWEHAYARLLFDPAGGKRLLTNAVATSICTPSMDEYIDRWGSTRRTRDVDVWVLNARGRWDVLR